MEHDRMERSEAGHRRRPRATHALPDEIPRAEAGRRLKAAREAAGWPTAYAAAAACGINIKHLYLYESGQRMPDWPQLLRLMVGLGLDPEILFPECYAQPKETT